jgi:uncharacterized protein
MRQWTWGVVLVVQLLLVTGVGAAAQRTDTVRIAVGEDIELVTLVHRPDGAGPHPVVLIRTPYRSRGGSTAWMAERLVPHGYAVVEQDVRGTGESTGAFVPFLHDAADGSATLDWLARQPWAGPVGLWGISYSGWAAYALAETQHPTVAALAVGSAWADMGPFLFPGGAFHLGAHLPWLMGFAGGAGVPTRDDFQQIARTLPLMPLLGPGEALLPLARRPFRWDAVDLPALHFTGWHDYIYRDALAGYAWLRASPNHGGDQRLIVGAWSHNGEKTGQTRVGDVDFGPAAAAGLDSVAAWTLRFFDTHLQGREDASAPVRVFVMGENHWREFQQWPPRDAMTGAWYVGPDGRLDDRPQNDVGITRFRYDPADPMPTLGGVNTHFFPANLGPLDQRPLDRRTDLARFETPPLRRAVVLAGPMRAVLHVEADAPATDIAVKLISVAPDGTARLVEDGIHRVASLPSGVSEIAVNLGERALRLAPGERLRLDVTGGNFPKYDRNPNTGADALTATTLRPVTISIHHGRAHPSRLELTTLPD